MAKRLIEKTTSGTIKVSGVCSISGDTFVVEVPESDYNRWQNGEYIQTVFARLTPDQREFLKTGYTPAEWDAIFGSSDESA